MRSKLQLDVHYHNWWWHFLMSSYEIEAGMVLFAGRTVWSMPECLWGKSLLGVV